MEESSNTREEGEGPEPSGGDGAAAALSSEVISLHYFCV